MEDMIFVVSAKLQPPVLRKNTVQRRRLLEALNRVTSHRLTLVCAGAGYGKTTLLSNITSLPAHVVWYSLSRSDQDLAVFTTYLVEGVRRYHPGFGGRVLQLLTGSGQTNAIPEAIAGHLVNALGQIDQKHLIVVLDDYHFVDRNQAVRKVSDYLLVHLPTNVHIVIASRRRPHLPSLPRLRMVGAVNEILEQDLRFTAEEVRELFGQVYGLRASEKVMRVVTEQTEGWVIGLQLAAQSLMASRGQTPDVLTGALGANKQRLFEYLAEEVFKRQPANVRRFLCETSVLSTLSAEICDAIFGRTDSAAMLDYIEQNNLFIVKVDEGCWRYHHLFRDFLRQQASKESGYLNHLHCRAGAYFENCENHVQAIQHYLAGADYQSAARLISKIGHALFTTSRFDTLTFWIGQIPQHHLEKAPDLLLLHGQVLDAQGHYHRALVWFERALQAYAANEDDIGVGRVLSAKAYTSLWRLGRVTEAERLYRDALSLLDREDKAERGHLLRGLALCYLSEGNQALAEQNFRQALRMCEEARDLEGTLATLTIPGAWIYFWRGDFAEALACAQRALDIAKQINSKYWLAECLSNMSPIYRFLGRCEKAKECAQKALQLSREIGSVQIQSWSLAYAGLAHDGRQVPDYDAAKRFLHEAAELAERTGNERALIRALNSEVIIRLRLGEATDAIQVADRALEAAEGSTDRLLVTATRMVAGAALLGYDDVRAESLLLRARDDFLRYDDKFDLTRVNLWLAALYARPKTDVAMDYFKASLGLARQNGYDFWLVEEYHLAVPLLTLAICRDIHREYCEHLLDNIGPAAVDHLLLLLDHEDLCIRRVAAEQVRRLGGAGKSSASVLASSRRRAASGKEKVTLSRSAPEEPPAPLRICCFGNFRVWVGDRLVQEREWQRKDVKSLLKYLAATRGHTVAREQLIDLLWADLRPEVARSKLWKGLYLLRRVLEPDAKSYRSSYIDSCQGLLTLRSDRIEMIDVDEFERHLEAGTRAERFGDLDRALQEYEAAEMLYAGEFLADDPYEDWTMSKREQFRNRFVSTLEKIARWRADRGEYEAATVYMQKLLEEDPTREDICAMLMRCLARMGRRRDALSQYATCCRTLKEDLHLDPTAETQELYARLLAGEPV